MSVAVTIGVIALVLSLALVGALVLVTVPEADPARALAPWSEPLAVAQAFHLDAPAVAPVGAGWAAVWADGVDLFFRQIAPGGALADARTLVPGTRTPWNPVLLPAPEDGWLLLWQDLDALGDARLYGARLAADGTLLRGPVGVGGGSVSSVAAAPGGDGSAVVVWADTAPRPTLYGQRLDSEGRPSGPAVPIARGAEHPALARTGAGTWLLAWLSPDDTPAETRQAVIHATDAALPWEGDDLPVRLGAVEIAGLSTYVEAVRLGLDRDRAYLFVGRRDAADNAARTDALVIDLSGGVPVLANRIEGLALPTDVPAEAPEVVTGFNTGPAYAQPAAGEGVPVGWPAPAWGQFDALPVAFEARGAAVIGYLRGGALVGWQPVGPNARAGGALGLWTDRDRHLTLAWADLPREAASPATLVIRTTRAVAHP